MPQVTGGDRVPANVVAPDVTLNPGELFVPDALASQVTGAPQAHIRWGKRLKGRDRVSRP